MGSIAREMLRDPNWFNAQNRRTKGLRGVLLCHGHGSEGEERKRKRRRTHLQRARATGPPEMIPTAAGPPKVEKVIIIDRTSYSALQTGERDRFLTKNREKDEREATKREEEHESVPKEK
jgi:hypothetical protein